MGEPRQSRCGCLKQQTWPAWLWDQWCPAVFVFKLWSDPRGHSSGQFFAELLLGFVLKGKPERQLRNRLLGTAGVDLQVRYFSGQALTPLLRGDRGPDFSCSFLGCMLYQVDSWPLHDLWCSWEDFSGIGAISWNVQWIVISTDQRTRKKKSCLPREQREVMYCNEGNVDFSSDRPLSLSLDPATFCFWVLTSLSLIFSSLRWRSKPSLPYRSPEKVQWDFACK